MKVTIFRNDERVHEWFLNCDDPNEMAMTITNCGHAFVRVSVEEFRRMQNELEELKMELVTQWWKANEEDKELRNSRDRWKSRCKTVCELSDDFCLEIEDLLGNEPITAMFHRWEAVDKEQ